MYINYLAKPIMWITIYSIYFDLCVISVDSYGRIGPIFWAIESFPPKAMTLVEHMLMNSSQISLIGCHF